MNSTRRPTLAIIVYNGIHGDSRVLKTALTAARAGWDVTLIGRAPRAHREESMLGPVRVIRLPLVRTLHDRFEQLHLERHAAQLQPTPTRGVELARALGRLGRRLPRGSTRVARAARSLERRLTPALSLADLPPALPTAAPEDVDWRRDWPILTDWWLSFSPELLRLAPDLIHANDSQMLAVAARTAAELRLRGGQTAWVYDSHEYVPMVDWGHPTVSAAYRQLEREYIGRSDAVVTVSPAIAEMLQAEYDLAERPHVVANAPVMGVTTSAHSVRESAGLAPDVPLMVYSGYLAPARGVDVVVEALTLLPGVHLAIVANGTSPTLAALLDQAKGAGVDSRVHVVPYVPPYAVPSYLSTADVGLIPFHPDRHHNSSLPTKLSEYLHARLPVVASDMETTKAFVTSTGVGAVFRSSSATELAEAVRTVLGDLEAHRAAITDELLADLSWERQAEVLLAVYEKVSGHRPVPPAEPVSWDVEETPVAAAVHGQA
jgi:glycosyltransferase involved in cell wall biosynthesis